MVLPSGAVLASNSLAADLRVVLASGDSGSDARHSTGDALVPLGTTRPWTSTFDVFLHGKRNSWTLGW